MVLGWFGVVIFPLSPPDVGLKIIVWLSRRWGLHCCGSQLKPRVEGGRVDLHVPWRTWCSVGSILAVLCGECALIRR